MLSEKNPNVDKYFDKVKKWQEELKKLRTIILDSNPDYRIIQRRMKLFAYVPEKN